jgi:aminobenzoyl-glutamate utilization protein B
MQKNLEFVGGYTMDPQQKEFALALQKTLPEGAAGDLSLTDAIQPLRPFDPNAPSASTDVGDISWTVPTIGLSAATFVPGSSAHTWQAAATTGTSIGQDGMVIAAKTLAIMAVELFKDPELVAKAKVEFARQMKGKIYETAIPAGQKPLLDYREN